MKKKSNAGGGGRLRSLQKLPVRVGVTLFICEPDEIHPEQLSTARNCSLARLQGPWQLHARNHKASTEITRQALEIE